VISAGVTLAAQTYPPLYAFSMRGYFLAAGDWIGVAIQMALHQFLHGGMTHWISNAIFLIIFTPMVMGVTGRRAYWALFLGNTVFVAAALLVFSPLASTVGISGFCMALAAWYALEAGRTDREQAKAGFALVALNVGMGFFGNVSLTAHAAGAVFGALFWLAGRAIGKLRR
jgi:membrane associated rhomboid family serine protease